MFGRRRMVTAVLATAAAVVTLGPASSGIVVPPAPHTVTPFAAGDPTSAGTTARTGVANDGSQPSHGTGQPKISTDGRWQVFTALDSLQPNNPSAQAGQNNVFVRDLKNGTTVQLSRGVSGGVNVAANGDSFAPDITSSGRFVTFITAATNIAGTAASTRSVVVCDRDPDGDGSYDEVGANNTLTNTCAALYTGPSSGAGSIVTSETPHIMASCCQVTWTENTDATHMHVFTVGFQVANGVITLSASPVQVANEIADPCSAANAEPSEDQPVISDNGGEIYFTADYASGCSAIVGTFRYLDPGFQQSERFDRVPAGCGSGFLGDSPTMTGECASGSGGASNFVSDPSIDQFGSSVLFHFEDGPGVIGFTNILSSGTEVDWMVLATSTSSQVISRDNSGTIVDSTAGAISDNGRYVVFDTLACGASDGADLLPCQNPQILPSHELIARDLQLDAQRAAQGQTRLAGALVTFHTPSLPNPPNCTPAAGQLCVSQSGVVSNITLDSTGTYISYASSAFDLVTGDSNSSADSFVHTWQPTVSIAETDFGDVEVGTPKSLQIPVVVTGFGPIRFGATQIAGANPTDFAPGASTCNGQVADIINSCVVTVVTTPSPPVGTTHTATVLLPSPQFTDPVQVADVSVNVTDVGEPSPAADNTRTSVHPDGAQGHLDSSESMISGNGRWQVFTSEASLTGRQPIDPPGPNSDPIENIFVRDLADPENTVQISLHSKLGNSPKLPSTPVQVKGHPTGAGANDSSFSPSISADGRFVSFITDATDIVPTKFLGSVGAQVTSFTVVVCDRDPDGNGVFDEVIPGTRVPNYKCWPVESGTNSDVAPTRLASDQYPPRLSGDGSRITYVVINNQFDAQRAVTSNLSTPGGPLHAPTAPAFVPIHLGPNSVFTGSAGGFNFSDALQSYPRLTFNGKQVVFDAEEPCCEGDFRAVIRTTLPNGASVEFDTLDNGNSYLGADQGGGGTFDPPAISDDGTRVAFAFRGVEESFSRVYVVTLQPSGLLDAHLESFDRQGFASAGNDPALSGDGRYLAFVTSHPEESRAVDPPAGSCEDHFQQQNEQVFCQVVARDLSRDQAFFDETAPFEPSEIVSSSLSTSCPNPLPVGRLCGGNDDSSNPSIDATGSEIGFDSFASDIVEGDTNQVCPEGCSPVEDTFVHTWRPTLTVTPGTDFGTVAVGAHKDRTFTATLTGFGPISTGVTKIGGANAGDFSVRADGCAGQTLHAGAPGDTPCTVKLRFQPTAGGHRTATFAIPVAKNSYPRHNPDNSISYDPAALLDVTGIGLANGGLSPDPTTIDFGKQLPLAPGHTKTLTLTNTGGGPITVTDVTVQDTTHVGASGDYTVNATDCLGVLQVGDSCVVTVTFVGHKTGNRGAQLVITDNLFPTPTLVGLLARVPKPKILINPGVIAPGQVTQISGKGFAPHRLVDVTLKRLGEHATVRANGKGKFDVGLVIFHSTPEGPRTVVAHTHNADKSIGTDDPLLIASGTIDDLQLVTRH